ncbi:MAG: hypothetical protein FWB73_00485 [Treponema sp.]|nr:hypothetical protein [Treponema sp.]
MPLMELCRRQHFSDFDNHFNNQVYEAISDFIAQKNAVFQIKINAWLAEGSPDNFHFKIDDISYTIKLNDDGKYGLNIYDPFISPTFVSV